MYFSASASFGAGTVLSAIGAVSLNKVKDRSHLPFAAILISYIITAIFYEDYNVLVWCFFASIISVTVVFIMNQFKIHGSHRTSVAVA